MVGGGWYTALATNTDPQHPQPDGNYLDVHLLIIIEDDRCLKPFERRCLWAPAPGCLCSQSVMKITEPASHPANVSAPQLGSASLGPLWWAHCHWGAGWRCLHGAHSERWLTHLNYITGVQQSRRGNFSTSVRWRQGLSTCPELNTARRFPAFCVIREKVSPHSLKIWVYDEFVATRVVK